MAITFTILPTTGSTKVRLTNTNTTYSRVGALILYFTGTISGAIAEYTLSSVELILWDAGTPIDITVAYLTDGDFTVLPDDFYRIQIKDPGVTPLELSGIMTICSYTYIQNEVNNKIIHSERVIGMVERHNIHAMFIHIRALEILGSNPPLSMEDTCVTRIKYLKTV